MTGDPQPRLVLEEITGGYGGLPIVRGVSLGVPASTVSLVIGPNGSGKSTLLRAVSGVLPQRGGRVVLVTEAGAEEVQDLPTRARLAKGMTYVPQEHTGFGDMTVEENLLLGGWLWKRDRKELASRISDVYGMIPPLHTHRDRKVGELSGGQQRMLEVGRALMSRPSVLLLDEPTAGLAPAVATQLLELFRRLATDVEIGVLLVEQNIMMALDMADRVATLVGGRKEMEDSAESVRGRITEIVESWLWSDRLDDDVQV